MINNKKLLMAVLGMLPIVVISFVFKSAQTNFNLEKNSCEVNDESSYESNELLEDKSITDYTIKVLVKGETISISLEDYIVGVVAGEMPASFDVEALKAQAVASRTYALYKKSSNSGGEYDLTDNTNTQVYLSMEDMRAKWGNDFQRYYDKIVSAVNDTKGEVITYNGEIIEAFYFAMSAGNTENSVNVFSETRNYLQSVESSYDDGSLKGYEKEYNISIPDFKKKLDLSCEVPEVININYNDTGYVKDISICSKTFSGPDFRVKLGLRSANFDINIGEAVTIKTRGYGHGVGMSQYGANGYANHGYTYEDIIKHYYTGVEITKLENHL